MVLLSNMQDLVIENVYLSSFFFIPFEVNIFFLEVPSQITPWGCKLAEHLVVAQRIKMTTSVITSQVGVKV